MMAPSTLLGIAAAVALAASAMLLVPPRDKAALRRRLRAAAPPAFGQAPPDAGGREIVVIRTVTRSSGRWLTPVLTLVGHQPDRASVHTLDWPAIALVATLAGFLSTWRACVYIGPLSVLPGLVCAVMTTRGLLEWQRRRYRDQLFAQIPEAIGLVIRAVSAGVPVTEALRSEAREMPEPTRAEFTRVVGEIAIGRATDQAIWLIYHRKHLAEYCYLAVALGLQAQTGGRLAETGVPPAHHPLADPTEPRRMTALPQVELTALPQAALAALPWAVPIGLGIVPLLFVVGVALLAVEAERLDVALRIGSVAGTSKAPDQMRRGLRRQLLRLLGAIGQAAKAHALVSQKDVTALESVMRAAGCSTGSFVLAWGSKASSDSPPPCPRQYDSARRWDRACGCCRRKCGRTGW